MIQSYPADARLGGWILSFEQRLREMGIALPEAPRPVAAYVPAVQAGDLLFTSGQIPLRGGEMAYKGKVGRDLSEEDGYQAARLCALNCLAVARAALGSLDRVRRVVKVVGYVNSAPGFTAQPRVLNGASDLLQEVFGEAGRHARSAVGAPELPLDAAVEVEMVFEVTD